MPELIPKREVSWLIVTVEEALTMLDKTVVIWWRPNMTKYSQEEPEKDPCWVTGE